MRTGDEGDADHGLVPGQPIRGPQGAADQLSRGPQGAADQLSRGPEGAAGQLSRGPQGAAGQLSRGPQGAAGQLSRLLEELAVLPQPTVGLSPLPGTTIGRFELTREVGSGGFGVVWEALDRELHRRVAFKLVRAGRASSGAEQLRREAEAVASLQHPNLVTLFDVGRCEHGPYLVLELLDGETLLARLARGPLAPAEALRIAQLVADGLAHAHARGVIHRDLKPSNVFLCADGAVKILDFGMAHAFGRAASSGGTPGYMAPEQWRGAEEDERTDVFAFGVMLHEMLAGALPFPPDGGRSVQGPAPAPRLDPPGLPALGPVVSAMLAQDPAGRPRDGADVRARLDEVAETLPAQLRRGPGRPGRRRWLALAALPVVATVALLASSWLGPRPAPARPVVAVADLENLTGDPACEGLSELLITALEQSRWVMPLTRGHQLDVLAQAGREQVARIDEPLGRLVAERAGALLVLASLRRFDDLYAMDVKVIDPGRPGYVATAREEGRGKAAIPGLVDRVSDRLRQALSERPGAPGESGVAMAAAVPSLEAYEHYFRGQQLYDQAAGPEEADRAAAEFDQALAEDPSFALARLGKARAQQVYGRIGTAEAAALLESALRDAGRLPRKERLLAEALAHDWSGRHAESGAAYRLAVEAYPEDKRVLQEAGEQRFNSADYAAAIPLLERALVLDPGFGVAHWELLQSLELVGRRAEALARGRAFAARLPGDVPGACALSELLAMEGEVDESLTALARCLGTTSSANRLRETETGRALLHARRYRQASEVLARWRAGFQGSHDGTTGEEAYGLRFLATALVYQGRVREALDVLSPKLLPLSRAELLAFLGDGDGVERLYAGAPAQRGFEDAGPLLLAYLGRPDPAAARAGQVSRELSLRYHRAMAQLRSTGDTTGLAELAATPGQTPAAFFLGEALLAGGDASGAATALRRFQAGHRGALLDFYPERPGVFDGWALPRSQVLLARALAAQGDVAGARQALAAFRLLWKGADPGQALVAEAGAVADGLGGR